MSSSKALVASGSALPGQSVQGMLKDLRATTSAKRPASSSDSSPDSDDARQRRDKGKGYWETDVEPMTDDGSDDGSDTVTAQVFVKEKKKKKKLKAQISLENLKKTGDSKPKIPIKSIKAPVERCMQIAPQPKVKHPAAEPAATAEHAATGAVPRPKQTPLNETRIYRSVSNRLFIEFLGLQLHQINATKVRGGAEQTGGPLLADVPAPSSTYVRVHLGGPEKGPNKTRLLGCTDIAGYNIKVSEPRQIMRHRGRNVQKVIKGVPCALSDEEILTCLREQESCTPLKVARILKMKDKVKVPTSVVKLDFAPGTVVPTRIYIGFQSFKTKNYIPAPTRSFRCM